MGGWSCDGNSLVSQWKMKNEAQDCNRREAYEGHAILLCLLIGKE